MAEVTPFTGELQTQVMSTLWRLGGGTVEQVRSALPPRYRGAYNTIQTVLNRLAERGVLDARQRPLARRPGPSGATSLVLFFLPRTQVFESLTHWCLHAVLPGLADDLNVEGHGVGDLLPAAAVAAARGDAHQAHHAHCDH